MPWHPRLAWLRLLACETTSFWSLQLWRAVCDALGVDLTGQTSASFSLRNNYERCVLPLENHLLKHGAQGLSNFPVITGRQVRSPPSGA